MNQSRAITKSRGGCHLCKSRKIKCDETRPYCKACTRRGKTCPGYDRPLRWSRKHELRESSVSGPSNSRGDSHSSQISSQDTGPLAHYDSGLPTAMDGSENRNHGESNDDIPRYIPGNSYEDMSSIIAQELMPATPPFMYSDFFSQGLSGLEDDMSMSQQLQIDAQGSDVESFRTGILAAPVSNTSTGENALNRGQDISFEAVEDGNDEPTMSAGSPRDFLHVYYRLSSPRSLLSLSGEDFVRHYFKHVCRLHSCFDSDLNPFRTLVASCWSDCSTIYLTIQSMAIAHIANWYPYMAPLGISKRSQAWKSLQRDLQLYRTGRLDLDRALLSLLLLGISANWQDSKDLGLQYLHIARNLIQERLRNPKPGAEMGNLNDFWATSLVYWEMLASFVDNVPIAPFDGHGLPHLQTLKLPRPIMPHPLTGIGTEIHFALAEIGRMLRRKLFPTATNPTQDGLSDIDLRWLESIETFLFANAVPTAVEIEDYGDTSTSKIDLIQTAEAYRNACLLEIYRLSPELLLATLADDSKKGRLPFTIPQHLIEEGRDVNQMLASIAIQTLSLINGISLSSGASRQHPLLMVICANQLRVLDDQDQTQSDDKNQDITDTRCLVEARTLALSRKLPQGPLLKVMDIIKEVWDRLDGGLDSHWISVMHEKGWQTIIG